MDLTAWELLLPAGILDYFEVVSAKNNIVDYTIKLEEKHVQPGEFAGKRLSSHGFYNEVTIKDFPLRGKACYLKVNRRRWIDEDIGEIVSRNWDLVARGTRMTQEFASFLKEMHRQHPGKL
ncbi:ISAon1 family transposase N-terminal region protein [Marinoscillum sp.]|uniref:ISAon1 family transposase N-terminal region protein n=1 Tax=Marinoscillum sp. TaxID=2024838 RepID=UPI003BAC8A42